MAATEHPDFREGVPFLGGRLWIDLLNTTPVIGGMAMDLIKDDAALRRWAGLAGIEAEMTADADEVSRTQALRETLRTGFAALASRRPLPETVVADVNALLDHVEVRLRMEPSEQSVTGVVLAAREVAARDAVAVAAALDFARFAEHADPARLRHCANPACTMVFHDHGKNNRRRWCSMAACGNRDKVANFRARRRGDA